MSATRTPLLLIRHGQTPWNADGRWQGHGDPDLTEEGHAQASRIADVLSQDQRRDWTRVISSDLLRARQTAEIVARRLLLPIEFDLRIRELDVGTWVGLTRSEIEQRDAETLRRFERGEPFVRPGGGESRVEIRERTHEFVSELATRYSGDRVIIVTHLGVIRALVPGADPKNAEQVEVIAEEIAARPIDRVRRSKDGVL